MVGDARDAVRKLLHKSRLRPRLGIILGSGFQGVLSAVRVHRKVPYSRLPGMRSMQVRGHPGVMVLGELGDVPVVVMAGRLHVYEGWSVKEVVRPVRVLAGVGVELLLLTNASGAVNPRWAPGDLVVIRDHLNLMGASPLCGECGLGGAAFVDMTDAYDPALVRCLKRVARAVRMNLRSGVYAAVPGPQYETPAEVKALAGLGVDLVGMSTVPEVIMARRLGLRVAALSCVTNLAAGLSKDRLTHASVLKEGARAEVRATRLITGFCRQASALLKKELCP